MEPTAFADKQLELAAELGKFVFDHPETALRLPEGAFVYFEVTGEPECNEYGRQLGSANAAQVGRLCSCGSRV